MFGVSQRRDGQAERAALAGQLLPLLDGALAERGLAHERGPSGVLQGSGDDLAGGGAPAVDETDDPEVVAGRDTRRVARSCETWAPDASSSQNTGPDAMNWLATARAAVT